MQAIALAAVFNARDEVLLLKRPPGTPQGGLWSLPGGHIEPGETPLEAARRELFEETCVAGEAWCDIGACAYRYPDAALHFHLFACRAPQPSALACAEPYVWTAPGRLHAYRMPRANIERLNPMIDDFVHRAHGRPFYDFENTPD